MKKLLIGVIIIAVLWVLVWGIGIYKLHKEIPEIELTDTNKEQAWMQMGKPKISGDEPVLKSYPNVGTLPETYTTNKLYSEWERESAVAVDSSKIINYREMYPTAIVFGGIGDKEVGRLEYGTGKLVFTGNADESAKIFFNHYLKPLVDEYIRKNKQRR